MNERIKELAEQAGVKMNAYGRPIPASLASNFDEFAELIVQKCADIGQQYADGNYEVYNQIMAHFGMEEE